MAIVAPASLQRWMMEYQGARWCAVTEVGRQWLKEHDNG